MGDVDRAEISLRIPSISLGVYSRSV